VKFLFALVSIAFAAVGQDYRVDAAWPQLPAGMTLGQVTGVAVDAKNQVWVFHRDNARPILCFDGKTGKLLKTIGAGLIENAHGLSVDPEGNLWITDLARHQILKLDPDGKVLFTLGEKGKAGWDAEHFNRPTMAAFDREGNAYIGDGYGNSRVVKFTKDGKFLFEWGKKGTGPGEFNIPHSIAIDAQGNVLVCDRANRRVQVFDAQGKFLTEWKSEALGRPWGIVNGPRGTFFIVDGGDEADVKGEPRPQPRSRLLQVDSKGNVLGTWGSYGKEAGNMVWAHDIAIGRDGAIYVGEVNDGKRVQKFVPVRK
jgi:DNA-binding beta-propeller fold protein YncE